MHFDIEYFDRELSYLFYIGRFYLLFQIIPIDKFLVVRDLIFKHSFVTIDRKRF